MRKFLARPHYSFFEMFVWTFISYNLATGRLSGFQAFMLVLLSVIITSIFKEDSITISRSEIFDIKDDDDEE